MPELANEPAVSNLLATVIRGSYRIEKRTDATKVLEGCRSPHTDYRLEIVHQQLKKRRRELVELPAMLSLELLVALRRCFPIWHFH